MKNKQALVIDDDPGMREEIIDRLGAIGHICDEAADVTTARKMMADKQYDFIVLDMELPMQYGNPAAPEVGQRYLAEIRRTHRKVQLPVFVVTGKIADSARTAEIMWTGANDFIMKPLPITGHTLEASIDKWYGNDQFEQQAVVRGQVPTASAVGEKEAFQCEEWLFRERYGTKNLWKALPSNGGEAHELAVGIATKIDRVLSCIHARYRRREFIRHGDFMDCCGWEDSEYFYKEKGKYQNKRCIMRNYLREIGAKLGVSAEEVPGGLRFNQPEE